ncbi:MAG: AMP-binding protein, partial [Acidobacteriota bacterium]
MSALNIPLRLVRFGIRCMVLSLYSVRVEGAENIPKTGGVLIISNHLSFMDGFLTGWAARHRNVRFMIWRPFYEHAILGIPLRALKAIPIGSSGPRDLVSAMKAARVELEAGHAVCIFAEGAVSRTGHLHPFKRGMERVVNGLDVPIVPMHLDRVWGGFFSFKGGSFTGMPKRWRWPITVMVGKPLPATTPAHEVRQAIAELGATAFALRKASGDTLPKRFIRMARKQWGKLALADSTGRELTYGRALTAALLLADVVRKRCGQEQMIGLLLPATAGGALTNMGVALAGKVAVNLNFTAGKESMDLAIAQCKIQTVITSKVFLAKAKLDAPVGCVYLEDILGSIGGSAKLWALVKARIAPKFALAPNVSPDSLATVIFSSGSTGVPKGVMLSHFNLISNVDAILEIFSLDARDRIIGTLPLFHSFGYLATIWLPLLAGCGVAYHPIPTDAKAIGELIEKYKGTFLLSTPTFCSAYMRKCTKQQFASLRFVVVGAEKLRDSLRQEFQELMGKELLEGYGCTELSPVVAVNSPDLVFDRYTQIGNRPGTIGLPIPGVAGDMVPQQHA